MSQHPKGSSHGLLVWTDRPRKNMVENLNTLFKPLDVSFCAQDAWCPDKHCGYSKEISIKTFIRNHRTCFAGADMNRLESWWNKVPLNTIWDFVSTCSESNGQMGLVIVEAKAHKSELKKDGKPIEFLGKNYKYHQVILMRNSLQLADELNASQLKTLNDKLRNHDSIDSFLSIAGKALSSWIPDNRIGISSYYQLSNRITTAWMLASCGIPTSLVYLGFVNDPYGVSKKPIIDSADWDRTISGYFAQVGADALLESESLILGNGCAMRFYSIALDLSTQQD